MLHGEIVCCICQGASSRDNNEIVLCDKCGAGKTMVLLLHPVAGEYFTAIKTNSSFQTKSCEHSDIT